jgi:starvation-inducible DNA-binding protein
MTQPVLKAKTTELHTQNGLLDGEKAAAAGSVKTVLADTFSLLIATQGLHWNVQGPMFYSIHKLTEAQYRDMFEAVDKLAERIRSLGFMAPHSAEELGRGSALNSPKEGDNLEAQIERLIEGNELIAKALRHALPEINDMSDVKTADLFTKRIGVHEENAWMLRAIIS